MSSDEKILSHFVELDDFDIWSAIKAWAGHPDVVLSYLAKSILHRNLLKIVLAPEPFDEDFQLGIRELIEEQFNLPPEEAALLMIAGRLSNSAYNAESHRTHRNSDQERRRRERDGSLRPAQHPGPEPAGGEVLHLLPEGDCVEGS